jgi:hypothetical protein
VESVFVALIVLVVAMVTVGAGYLVVKLARS